MPESANSREKYENLRKLVEAVDRVADEGQRIAPRIEELSEEFEYKPQSIINSIDENYSHVVRTAGYVPTKHRNTGDKMALYDKLVGGEEKITLKTVSNTEGIGRIRTDDGDELTHNQAREKLGLDPTYGLGWHRGRKIYEHDGDRENIMHEIRRINDRSLEEDGHPPKNEDLNLGYGNKSSSKISDIRKEAGVPYHPITHLGGGTLTEQREDNVFEFWVDEYLKRDWEGKSPDDVDTIMKMSMMREVVAEWELNAVAGEYEKWIDWDRYE